MPDTFYELCADAAEHELNDFVAHITMVEGTPVVEMRPQGDMTTAISYWSVSGNTLTPASAP